MTVQEFTQLPEIIPEKGKVGDCFLTPKLVEQKTGKKAGEEVSYYQIIRVSSNGNIEYITKYDVLIDR